MRSPQTYEVEVTHHDPADQDVYFSDYQIQAHDQSEAAEVAIGICQAEHPDTYISEAIAKEVSGILGFEMDIDADGNLI